MVPAPHTMAFPGTYTTFSTPAPILAPVPGSAVAPSTSDSGCMDSIGGSGFEPGAGAGGGTGGSGAGGGAGGAPAGGGGGAWEGAMGVCAPATIGVRGPAASTAARTGDIQRRALITTPPSRAREKLSATITEGATALQRRRPPTKTRSAAPGGPVLSFDARIARS